MTKKIKKLLRKSLGIFTFCLLLTTLGCVTGRQCEMDSDCGEKRMCIRNVDKDLKTTSTYCATRIDDPDPHQ